MRTLEGWRMTGHAERRVAEMDVRMAEVVAAIVAPELEYQGAEGHPVGRRVRVAGRLAVVVDPLARVVVSVLWHRAEGRGVNGAPVGGVAVAREREGAWEVGGGGAGGWAPVLAAEVQADGRAALTSPELAADALAPAFVGLDREACVVAMLDTKHRLLALELVSLGSVDHTFMAPREVYRCALLRAAAAVIVAHQHPSGDPEPSDDDVAVAQRLALAGSIVGVELLDALVFGGARWVSLARRGVVGGAA